MQGEYGVKGGIPAPVRIRQEGQHIRHGIGQNRRRLDQKEICLRLNLLTQPRRLTRAREVGTPRQVVAPLRVAGRTPVYRGVEQLSHLPSEGNRTADPRMRMSQFLGARPPARAAARCDSAHLAEAPPIRSASAAGCP